jgi:hypothetical protein
LKGVTVGCENETLPTQDEIQSRSKFPRLVQLPRVSFRLELQ